MKNYTTRSIIRKGKQFKEHFHFWLTTGIIFYILISKIRYHYIFLTRNQYFSKSYLFIWFRKNKVMPLQIFQAKATSLFKRTL